MMTLSLVWLLATTAVLHVAADDWAVVVAGSNGWDNYRHQADACHAYQTLTQNGMESDHIIMMYYDDIAANTQNPFPGQIFNHPTRKGTPGVDVYAGCQKDYTGSQVTAQNFLNVITGNSSAMHGIGSGKVLQSGPNDRVFLNFVDHGGSGILAFPAGAYLTSTQLMSALQTMFSQRMYQKLVFYVEACESGSMFASLLPANMEIYATTAASPNESSWGTYCPPQDFVNGKALGTCLGDTYSVNWMQDADKQLAKKKNQTLEVQYKVVRKATTQSHVMQYGDETWTKLPIDDFEGQPPSSPSSSIWPFLSRPLRRTRSRARRPSIPGRDEIVSGGIARFGPAHAQKDKEAGADKDKEAAELEAVSADMTDEWRVIADSGVDSRDIPLHLAYYRYLRAGKRDITVAHGLAAELQGLIAHRVHVDTIFFTIARVITGGSSEKAHAVLAMDAPAKLHVSCIQKLMQEYESHCGRMDDYALQYIRVLANLCDMAPVKLIVSAISSTPCSPN